MCYISKLKLIDNLIHIAFALFNLPFQIRNQMSMCTSVGVLRSILVFQLGKIKLTTLLLFKHFHFILFRIYFSGDIRTLLTIFTTIFLSLATVNYGMHCWCIQYWCISFSYIFNEIHLNGCLFNGYKVCIYVYLSFYFSVVVVVVLSIDFCTCAISFLYGKLCKSIHFLGTNLMELHRF